MQYRDNLQRSGLGAVDHDVVWIARYRPEANRQCRHLHSFLTQSGVSRQACSRRQDSGFSTISRRLIIFGNVIPDLVKVVERAKRQLKSGRHRSRNAPLCPPILENLDRQLGIHKFPKLGLCKAFGNLSSNGFPIRPASTSHSDIAHAGRQRLDRALLRRSCPNRRRDQATPAAGVSIPGSWHALPAK